MSLTYPLRAYLAAVEARAQAATLGPWFVCVKHKTAVVTKECGVYPCEECGREYHDAVFRHRSLGTVAVDYPDAIFIASSRTDLPRLAQMLQRCVEAMEQARRESASEPKSAYARAATIILNAALTDLAALCEGGKG